MANKSHLPPIVMCLPIDDDADTDCKSESPEKADAVDNAVLNACLTKIALEVDACDVLDFCSAAAVGLADKLTRYSQGPLIPEADVAAIGEYVKGLLEKDLTLLPMTGLTQPGCGMYVIEGNWIRECEALHRTLFTIQRVGKDLLSRQLGREVRHVHVNFATGLLYNSGGGRDGEPGAHKIVVSISERADARVDSQTMTTMDALATFDDPHWHQLEHSLRQQLVVIAASAKAHGFLTSDESTALKYIVGSGGAAEFDAAVTGVMKNLEWATSVGVKEKKEGEEVQRSFVPAQRWHIDAQITGTLRSDCSLAPGNPNLLFSLSMGALCYGPQLALCQFDDEATLRPWLVQLGERFPRFFPVAAGACSAARLVRRGDVAVTFTNAVHRGIRMNLKRNRSDECVQPSDTSDTSNKLMKDKKSRRGDGS
jgi:hypothetical protein